LNCLLARAKECIKRHKSEARWELGGQTARGVWTQETGPECTQVGLLELYLVSLSCRGKNEAKGSCKEAAGAVCA
ncbi:hypothetical protein KUCAC02_000336, partial [Chaenocephalus aceratus]